MRSYILFIGFMLCGAYCCIAQENQLEVEGDVEIVGKLKIGDETLKNVQVGIGTSSGVSGSDNSLFGISAGAILGAGSHNSVFGSEAGFLLINGNRNSIFGSDAGRFLNNGSDNSMFGYKAGQNSGASNNSFFGSSSGRNSSTGGHNSFFGANSGGATNVGLGNSFFGSQSGFINQSGEHNSFFGYESGYFNFTGHNNSFFGSGAGYSSSTGVENSFFGADAGSANQNSFNSFFGFRSGAVNRGDANSFFGHKSGEKNLFGEDNTFFGKNSGLNNTSGLSNTLIGGDAGDAISTGDNNTMVGFSTDGSSADAQNQIVIGCQADGQGDNTAVIGNGFITTVYMNENGTASVMSSSDRRMKRNILDSKLGLNFIKELRPVQYYWKNKLDFPSEFIENETAEELKEATTQPRIQHGLIAQEVKEVIDKLGIEWQGWHENADTGRQGLNYAALTVPLIQAIKEQQGIIDQLNQNQKLILEYLSQKRPTQHLDNRQSEE